MVSSYATQYFPTTSLGFIDFHAALAHAMAGNNDALMTIVDSPGASGDLVPPIAMAYKAIAEKNWADSVRFLTSAMADHARLGGSRAQRDILELTLAGTLINLGNQEEARRLLLLRRPVLADSKSLHGLHNT